MSEVKDKKKSGSEQIWDEIFNLPIDVYAVPNQKIQNYVERVNVPSDTLMAKVKSSAAVPALEIAIGPKYAVEALGGGKIVVSRVAQDFVEDEFETYQRKGQTVTKKKA